VQASSTSTTSSASTGSSSAPCLPPELVAELGGAAQNALRELDPDQPAYATQSGVYLSPEEACLLREQVSMPHVRAVPLHHDIVSINARFQSCARPRGQNCSHTSGGGPHSMLQRVQVRADDM